jgi:hypothetical protein
MEDYMLQRYDISMDAEENRLSIKEFAVLTTISRKREPSNPVELNYSLIHEEAYDVDLIRGAIHEGKEYLIKELRSDTFFPIQPCIEIIAEGVIELFDGDSNPYSKIFFDDRTTFSKEDEHENSLASAQVK